MITNEFLKDIGGLFMPGLVLEGGGMRGWYTAGVLSVFTENQISFPAVYGISAGAFNALPYLSGQCTAEFIRKLIENADDERFISEENLKKTGSVFGFGFLFGEVLHRLIPFDYDAFFRSAVHFQAGATDLKTGRPFFFDKSVMDEDFMAIRASCSLPVISGIIRYRGMDLLDGGYSDPIPAEHAAADGNEKNVIVLTRDASYRKETKLEIPRATLQEKYGDYPAFIEDVVRRPQLYNHELDVCAQMRAQGKAFLIRPSEPIRIGRCESDPAQLWEVFRLGVADCRAALPEIRTFIAEPV